MQTNYAGFGSRFLASLIDGAILFVVNLLIGMVAGSSLSTSVNAYGSGTPSFNGLSLVLQLVIAVLYWVVYQNKMGQTLGKKAMGIRVVDASGATPGMGTLALREIVGKLVSGLVFALGYLWILWDARKQGWHDKIAGTFVVRV